MGRIAGRCGLFDYRSGPAFAQHNLGLYYRIIGLWPVPPGLCGGRIIIGIAP